MLGVNSEQKESMQHYISDSIYGLALAWIPSENSTKQLECRHLDSIFFAGPYLLLTRHSAVPSPTASVRSFLQPTLFSRPVTSSGHAEISSPKNPLSGFAPKQTKESSAWRATYIVLHNNQWWLTPSVEILLFISLPFISFWFIGWLV